MNGSQHANPTVAVIKSQTDEDQKSTFEMPLSAIQSDDPLRSKEKAMDLNASLDLDRHISTQKPSREQVLRALRGEEMEDSCLGESFAIDDNYHYTAETRGRGTSLAPVPDVSISEDCSESEHYKEE